MTISGTIRLKKFSVSVPVVYKEHVEVQASDRQSAIGRALAGDGTLLRVDRRGFAGGGISVNGDHEATGSAVPMCFVSFYVHHRSKDERRARLLSQWVCEIVGKGWAPLLPTASWCGFYSAPLEGIDEHELLALSLAELSRSEAAVFLPDWARSERARAEREFAESNGILIYEYENPADLRNRMPTAQEFKEKYVSVAIVRDLGHAV